MKLLERSAVNHAPRAAAALHGEGSFEDRRLIEGLDDATDLLHTGWVGPDAFGPSPELGPAKYETATVISSAGNQGWPYCMGNKQPYRDRSSTDATVLTGWYDCDAPKNHSPRNTGLVDLPPVKNNMIWYAPGGGGPVFPNRPNSRSFPAPAKSRSGSPCPPTGAP